MQRLFNRTDNRLEAQHSMNYSTMNADLGSSAQIDRSSELTCIVSRAEL